MITHGNDNPAVGDPVDALLLDAIAARGRGDFAGFKAALVDALVEAVRLEERQPTRSIVGIEIAVAWSYRPAHTAAVRIRQTVRRLPAH